jgi:hypothetical protein
MNWFERYGIPGAYFCGISLIWFGAFYHCQFAGMLGNQLTIAIVGGVLAGVFLPLGYLLSTTGQILYHRCPGWGIDTQAREQAGIHLEPSSRREEVQEAVTVHQVMTTTAFSLEQISWLLHWMSKRMDMVVMNMSLCFATIASLVLVSLSLRLFFCWQVDLRWLAFAAILSICVFAISLWSRKILIRQLVRVEAPVLRRMAESRADPLDR